MQNGRTSDGKSPNGWFKLPRASSQDIGGHKHHRRVNEATFDKEQIRLAALLIGWYGPNQTHSDELNRALESPLRRGAHRFGMNFEETIVAYEAYHLSHGFCQ